MRNCFFYGCFLVLLMACSESQKEQPVSSPVVKQTDTALAAALSLQAELKDGIVRQCRQMGMAFQLGQFDKYVRFMHMHDLTQAGGPNMLARSLETFMRSSGVSVTRIDFSTPDTLMLYNGVWQGRLEQTLHLVNRDQQAAERKAKLIVFSQDQGKTWYFGDVTASGWEEARQNYPELSPDWQTGWKN